MDRREYLRDENWYGSFYEISLELGPTGNDRLALEALRALWSQPEIRGPWRERSDFDTERDDAVITTEEGCLYGCFTLDDGTEVGCMSHLIHIPGESDLLDLSIPTGMLELRFPISYPLDSATNPWMVQFEERLARIGAAIYGVAPFRLGLIGEEASAAPNSAADLTADDCELGGFLVPLDLWVKLSPKRKPVLLANGVAYVPLQGPHITYGA
jgi:hypothetical protein